MIVRDILLKANDLSVSFGSFNVLRNINLEIKKGEIFGVIGVSGVGKTTLLVALTGLINPDSGVVSFDFGRGLINIKKNKRTFLTYKSLIGFSTQESSFYPELTVLQNLQYFASLYGLKRSVAEENIKKVLDVVGLYDFKNTLASKLSGGMQKRLDIACSIIHRPLLLFLDEPTADLDPIMRTRIWDLITRINKSGTTVVVASHFLDELEVVCDRVAILNNKTINLVGSVADLRRAYSSDKEVHVITNLARYDPIIKGLRGDSSLGVKFARVVDNKLVIITSDLNKTLPKLLSLVGKEGDVVLKVEVKEPSIKEIFESIVG